MMLLHLQLLLQVDVLAVQFLGLDRVLDQDQSLLERERFFQEVVCAKFRRAHRGLDGAVAGDHDDFRRIVELANLLQRLEAVDAGQPDIEQHHVKCSLAQQVEAGFATLDRGCGVAFVGQNAGQGVANSGFVINDQDVMHVGQSPLPAWVREQLEVQR